MTTDSRVLADQAKSPDGPGPDESGDAVVAGTEARSSDSRASRTEAGASAKTPSKRGSDKPAPRANAGEPSKRPKPIPAKQRQVAAPEAADADAESQFLLWNAVPSWLVSTLVHMTLLIVLALFTLPEAETIRQILTISSLNEDAESELDEQEIDIVPVDTQALQSSAPVKLSEFQAPVEMTPNLQELDMAPRDLEIMDFGSEVVPKSDLMSAVGAISGEGVAGRGADMRREMVERYGGTEGSERAVAMALKWLADHQMRDGGWSFDHQRGPCNGRCSSPGNVQARNGATAMALLPFLGAGQTHRQGKYKETVERGLYFLLRQMKVRNGRGDLSDPGGRLYSHGLCAIALCEAYAMTKDPNLMQPAQLSLNFIVYAQDPVGGGWRYAPKQPGDTSVVGWQLMALKSGHMAYLNVPKETIVKAERFLDSVQLNSGAQYGYTAPAARPATTAVGLLSRMYLGWKKNEPGLQAGVEYLSGLPPSNNMYFNYYATQVMRHYEGAPWEKWNSMMRDRLVDSQDRGGHRKGSWYFENAPHGDRGGRLYCTSMATMILEVYYRHMPIYGKQAAEEDFPL